MQLLRDQMEGVVQDSAHKVSELLELYDPVIDQCYQNWLAQLNICFNLYLQHNIRNQSQRQSAFFVLSDLKFQYGSIFFIQ